MPTVSGRFHGGPEIHDSGVSRDRIQYQVGGFDVSMDDPRLMNHRKYQGNRDPDPKKLI